MKIEALSKGWRHEVNSQRIQKLGFMLQENAVTQPLDYGLMRILLPQTSMAWHCLPLYPDEQIGI